ncbi:MAG: phosphate-starvation-inducible PsiE family protein [Acidocella sp.]|nr:phosphate-starvation-inducible PsiE family protein [Acidocella sp.]
MSVQKMPPGETHKDIRALVFRIYDQCVELVILGVIPLMLVALGFAFVAAVVSTIGMFQAISANDADEQFLRVLVERVLDVVILIELFNTFMEYARTRHIRLANLLDVTIVFALREILIQLYAQVFSPADLVTLCILVIVLVFARSIAGEFSRSRAEEESVG